MTTRYETHGFIFKKTDVNEADKIFSVFTSDFGRLDVFAKAIRKSTSKLRGGMELFSFSEIEFIQGKNRKTLTDAVPIEKFNNISCDLNRFKSASGFASIIDNFIKGEDRDSNVFNLLNEVFSELNNTALKLGARVLLNYYFLWSMISLLGYLPEVNKCNGCGEKLNPYSIYFSNKSGGIVCKRCSLPDLSSQKINSDIVKILRLIFKKEWGVLKKIKIGPNTQSLLKNISNNYYQYILSSHSSLDNYRSV